MGAIAWWTSTNGIKRIPARTGHTWSTGATTSAHDNNRDAMGMTLELTKNVLNTYLDWHAQVLHDLHESVPFLYDNTVGDGPYNSWIDPILTDEWSMLASDNMARMQSFGMPGAFTHGNFDTWSPGYLMFLAAYAQRHQPACTKLSATAARTRRSACCRPMNIRARGIGPIRPNPTVEWSQRDNNNYEETALLSTLSYFAQNAKLFLNNFYLKSKRSVEKPDNEGPAAYVLAQDDSSWNRQMQLLKVLALQHVEIQRLAQAATVALPPPTHKDNEEAKPVAPPPPTSQTFAAGSFVIRMDQPFSRVADALLDRQYWSPDDPQKTPYDDTGWSFGDLFNAKVSRVTDRSILSAAMSPISDLSQITPPAPGTGPFYAVNNSSQVVAGFAGLRACRVPRRCRSREEAFESGGQKFAAGSLIIWAGGRREAEAIVAAARSGCRQHCQPALGKNSCCRGASNCFHSHLALHTDGGLVAHGV